MQLNNSLFDNIANFIKKRLIEFFGLILITLFFLYTFALVNYSAENSTLIYKADSSDTPNVFNYYSNAIADFFLQSFGLISFLIGASILSWGINLIISKKIPNMLSRFLYVVIYIFFGSYIDSINNIFYQMIIFIVLLGLYLLLVNIFGIYSFKSLIGKVPSGKT